ncbi:urate hydroxylase PuuD [Photobacterium sp. BZF1]|uniref:urate hydroxylase PuuD n=1 Tax=Photobacterium sp. BZF1 TaxID=1904457 RepID=UPI0016535AC8|nr:urate hydroxylase PuuD [Photobacterium sp. BZF1]MBC7002094.1 urate hydroxylase PuuD [Photobacterium sp. BZF1]
MWPQLYEWVSLFIKWFHVICAFAWIGASFYFTWLDNSLKTPPEHKKKQGIKGDLWAVHGGGFYEVAKYKAAPPAMPEQLHWFKWEAYSTWITGTLLLFWMYYFNAQAYLIDPRVMVLSTHEAIAMGVGGIVLGVMAYELILRSPISRKQSVFIPVMLLMGALFFYGFSQFFSGRGAFIHMGALIGSIMANNVFLKIIPGQRKMLRQVTAGQPVDPKPGLEGKRRSVHNNYFTLPVVFLMISNHYPMVYQHPYNWAVGMAILLISAYIRHYFNLKHSGKHQPWVLGAGSVAMLSLAVFISLPAATLLDSKSTIQPAMINSQADPLTPSQHTVMDIIEQRCSSCHSSSPTDDVFKVAPLGAVFDNWQDVERWRERILVRTVDTGDMPFLNKTTMTDEERKKLNNVLRSNAGS